MLGTLEREAGLEHLREAVEVLSESPARLEHALLERGETSGARQALERAPHTTDDSDNARQSTPATAARWTGSVNASYACLRCSVAAGGAHERLGEAELQRVVSDVSVLCPRAVVRFDNALLRRRQTDARPPA